MSWIQDHYLTLFGIVWVTALVYAICALTMVVRLRHLRRKTGVTTGFDGSWMNTFGLIGFILGGAHRGYGDALLTRSVLFTRLLFLLLMPAFITLFAVNLAPMFGFISGRMS